MSKKIDEIIKLKELLNQGTITLKEFKEMKKSLISKNRLSVITLILLIIVLLLIISYIVYSFIYLPKKGNENVEIDSSEEKISTVIKKQVKFIFTAGANVQIEATTDNSVTMRGICPKCRETSYDYFIYSPKDDTTYTTFSQGFHCSKGCGIVGNNYLATVYFTKIEDEVEVQKNLQTK